MQIEFEPPWSDSEHESFFRASLERAQRHDVYRQALFYTLGIVSDTRDCIHRLYDFETNLIIPEGLSEGWVTGGSSRLILLAFNLYNGFVLPGNEMLSTPYGLFDYGFGRYMAAAIRLRYPECFV